MLFLVLRKHTNVSKLKPSLACKIFEGMISPTLSYNGEIWRYIQNMILKLGTIPQLKKTLEILQTLLRNKQLTFKCCK